MLGRIEGTAGHPYKSAIVIKRSPARTLGDVCPNAVSSPDHLFSNRIFGEIFPLEYYFPDSICEILGKFIDPQPLKICPFHVSSS